MSEDGATVKMEKPKVIIDLNDLSVSALEEKIAIHNDDATKRIDHSLERVATPQPEIKPDVKIETKTSGDDRHGDGHLNGRDDDDDDDDDGRKGTMVSTVVPSEERRKEGSKAHFVGGKLEYCICRKPDINRFMIGCDGCNEWFHGDCIGILEVEARPIKRWYCKVCKAKDPSLKILYKSTKQSNSSSSLHQSHRDKSEGGKTKRSKRCGECIACQETQDCGRCDYCLDMPKFGGPFKRRQKCRQRQCIHLGKGSSKSNKHKYRSDSEDDIFVGDAHEAESEDGLFTGDEDEDDRNGGGGNQIPRKNYEFDPDFNPEGKKKKKQSSVPKSRPKVKPADEDSRERKYSPSYVDEEPRKKTLKLKNVDTPKSGSLAPSNSSSDFPSSSHRFSSSKNRDKGKDKDRKTKKTKKSGKSYRSGSGNDLFANSFLFDSGVEHQETSQEEPREELFSQCYGPGCTLASRTNSKYCSDDCGLKLATHRLCELLPQRIQQWRASSCTAEELDMKKLEKVRQKIGDKSKRLSELDRKYRAIDAIIERAHSFKADSDYDPDDEEDETEMMIYCVTCGHEVNVRRAAAHMERCFTRFESQTSFGTLHKTNMDGQSFFCDVFNKESNTYCKRLRVICPEHFKDKKVEPNEICGCPLTKGIFEETSVLCKAPKKKCVNHINWERLRRAEIDMERIGDLMELEELYDEERSIRQGMASRAGVLGLMLHSTIDHETLARQMQAQQRQQQMQQQQHLQRQTVKQS